MVQRDVLSAAERGGPHGHPAPALSMSVSQGWRRCHAAAGASLIAKPGDRAGGAVPPSRKLFSMLSGIAFSRFFWSFASIPEHPEPLSHRAGAAILLTAKCAKPAKGEECAFG